MLEGVGDGVHVKVSLDMCAGEHACIEALWGPHVLRVVGSVCTRWREQAWHTR